MIVFPTGATLLILNRVLDGELNSISHVDLLLVLVSLVRVLVASYAPKS